MNPRYRRHHPKWHREREPIFWWLRRGSYMRFIARELTSLAVGYSALLLVVQIFCLRAGETAWATFSRYLSSPWALGFHLLVVAALLFHTITWLALAPKAIVLRLGGRRLPDAAIVAGHYAAWVVASALVVWVLS
jgi:succinate dehydrogenase subunit C